MKRLYFLALLCCTGFVAFAQNTVTIYATGASTSYKTGSSDGYTRTPDNINTSGDTTAGYAVFDLAGKVPAGATIISVDAGIYVNAFIPGGGPLPTCRTYGVLGDLSVVTVPATLLADMRPPAVWPTGFLFGTSYGAGPGDVVMASTANSRAFITAAVATTPGKVTLTYTAFAGSVGQYYIQGESGIASTSPADVHVPYITIQYCSVPTSVSAIASPNPVCEGSALTLNGAADSVTDWLWTGPNGFTSTLQNPTLTATQLAAGVYTLTASNVCGATVNSVTVTTPALTVTAGPIVGITNAWVGFTTNLYDPTGGGTWVSSNPAIAKIGSSSGIVTGVSPGNVVISYTTPFPTGCVFSTNVLIVNSVFSQIPLVDPSAIGLGFPIVAWWPFCGDTLDHASYPLIGGHDLINHSATTIPAVLTTDRFGIPDNAYYYDGVNTMMQYTTFISISGPTGDFTYSCWFEADTEQNSIILYNGTFGTDGWGFVINDGTYAGAGNKVGVAFFPDPAFPAPNLFSSTPVTMNRWHNLMLKKNGGSYNFYVDNISIGFFIGSNIPVISGLYALGVDYATTVGPGPIQKAFKGKIDDIAIYNRQLNTSERDSLYNFNPDARIFSLGNDTTICVDSLILVPHPPTIGNKYQWFGATGAIPGANDSILAIHPLSGPLGNTYSLFVGKPYGCITSDEITVFNTPIAVNVGPDTIKACLGDTITLGDASFPTSAFLWNTGDTTHSISVYSSGIYTLAVDSIYHYGPLPTDTTTCVGRDTVVVHLYPVPIIGLDSFRAHCEGQKDTLVPHFDPAYTYQWSTPVFPNVGTDPTLVDSTIGLSVIYLKVTDTGCIRFDTARVLIVFDTLTFSVTDSVKCYPDFVTITSASVTNNFIANYQWTPTTGIGTSNVYDPVIAPDTSAEYYLRVTYPGCPDILDSFFLDIQHTPHVFLGDNRVVCQFDTLHLVSVIDPAWYTHYTYAWTPTLFLDSINSDHVIFKADTASDTVLLTLTVSTPYGLIDTSKCRSTGTVQIIVHPSRFDSLVMDTTICPGDSIQLVPVDTIFGSTATYMWSPGIYLDSTSSAPWVHPIKSIKYTMIGTNEFGCRDTLHASINVSPAAVLYLGDSVTIYPGESYQLSPQTNCVNFQWYPPLALDDDKISNPIATPDVHTKYIVYGSTEAGCKAVDSFVINVDPGNFITLPNAFTPGAGINNKFFVFKRGIVALKYFRIFNRWGNKVFETQNIDEGWDGMYNGKPQPFGVYMYEVEAASVDGKVYNRVGNVTLIR